MPNNPKKTNSLDLVAGKIRYYQIPIIVTIIVIGLTLTGWSQFGQIGDSQDQLKKSKDELQSINRKIAFLSSQDPNQLAQNKQIVNRALPGEKPVFAAVTGLRGAAEAANVDITELTSNPGSLATSSAQTKSSKSTQTSAKVNILRVEMRIEGSLDAINDYLLRLSQMVPLVGFESVNISTAGTSADTDEPKFGSDLAIHIYWMPPPSNLKSNPSTVTGLSEDAQSSLSIIESFQFYGLDI